MSASSTAAATLRRHQSTSPVAKKRLVIKPFRVTPQPPAAFEETAFMRLAQAVDAVYAARSVTESQEELYRSVESLCMHKRSEVLFDRLRTQCERLMSAQFAALATHVHAEQLPFLQHLDTLWRRHCDQLLTVRSIFLYLDRTYVFHIPSVRSIWDMGLHFFRRFFRAPLLELAGRQGKMDVDDANAPPGDGELEIKALAALLDLVARERRGETISRPLVKSIVRMLSAIQLYASTFEPRFLAMSQAYFEQEGLRALSTMQVADYLIYAATAIDDETQRVANYLEPATTAPLVRCVEEQLLRKHFGDLLAKGFDELMQARRIVDLKRMYGLAERVGARTQLNSSFAAYIKSVGTSLVQDDKKEATVIQELLDFKTSLSDVISQAFQSHVDFVYSLKASFESVMNARENKPSELLAKYLDRVILCERKGATSAELDQLLDQVLFLFRYIHGKDVFQGFYKQALAKRLLTGKSYSIDLEKRMIEKLRLECGASFTSRLEGMFRDMDLCQDVMKDFAELSRNSTSMSDLEMTVHVLTTGVWPTYTPVDMWLPPEVKAKQENFSRFYLNKHSGRKLEWQNSLATATVRAHFPRGRRELQVSGFQAVLLMQFNPTESELAAAMASSSSSLSSSSSSSSSTAPISMKRTYSELRQMSGLTDRVLNSALASMCMLDACRILLKEPKTKKIEEHSTYMVDPAFTSKLLRIAVPNPQLKEAKEEDASAVQTKVLEDRQYAIDAAIVRIMKSRKTLTHAQLMKEALGQLKFQPAPADVKARIGSLIEREYLERDKDDLQLYHYLA